MWNFKVDDRATVERDGKQRLGTIVQATEGDCVIRYDDDSSEEVFDQGASELSSLES